MALQTHWYIRAVLERDLGEGMRTDRSWRNRIYAGLQARLCSPQCAFWQLVSQYLRRRSRFSRTSAPPTAPAAHTPRLPTAAALAEHRARIPAPRAPVYGHPARDERGRTAALRAQCVAVVQLHLLQPRRELVLRLAGGHVRVARRRASVTTVGACTTGAGADGQESDQYGIESSRYVGE
ncbi:hypothetical protein AcW1_001712 [Taiwanofungus camphoratus]|nr:hypothetical protein AcW1_001712 [Antrodia cinnamomea]